MQPQPVFFCLRHLTCSSGTSRTPLWMGVSVARHKHHLGQPYPQMVRVRSSPKLLRDLLSAAAGRIAHAHVQS